MAVSNKSLVAGIEICLSRRLPGDALPSRRAGRPDGSAALTCQTRFRYATNAVYANLGRQSEGTRWQERACC